MNRGFGSDSTTLRLATFAPWIQEQGSGCSLEALQLATLGYFVHDQLIHCSGCGFHAEWSAALADLHFEAHTGCSVAMRHKLEHGPPTEVSSLSIDDVGHQQLQPFHANTHNQQHPADTSSSSSAVTFEANSSSLSDLSPHVTPSVQARVDSFLMYSIPNGLILAKMGFFMESEFTLKCCHCGLANFAPSCMLEDERGWQLALELHSNMRPHCPFAGGQSSN